MEQQASKKTRNPLGRWAVGSKRFMRAEFGGAGASTNSADATAFTHAHNWAKSDTCAKSNADGRSKSDAHNRADTHAHNWATQSNTNRATTTTCPFRSYK